MINPLILGARFQVYPSKELVNQRTHPSNSLFSRFNYYGIVEDRIENYFLKKLLSPLYLLRGQNFSSN